MADGCRPLDADDAVDAAAVDDGDDLGNYRDYYVSRVQGLERIKQRLASAPPSAPPSESLATKFDQLRASMVSLMENDVTLMRQLLSLGESVEALKASTSLLMSRSASRESLSTDDDDEDDDDLSESELTGTVNRFSFDSSARRPRRQYFSRQNSVLRIPIPPSHRPASAGQGQAARLSRFRASTSVPPSPALVEDDDDVDLVDDDSSSSGFSSRSSSKDTSRVDAADGSGSLKLAHLAGSLKSPTSALVAHRKENSVDSGFIPSPVGSDTKEEEFHEFL